MEFYLPIGNRQLWTLFINTLSPLRSAWPIPMPLHEFTNNIQFQHHNAEMVWQQERRLINQQTRVQATRRRLPPGEEFDLDPQIPNDLKFANYQVAVVFDPENGTVEVRVHRSLDRTVPRFPVFLPQRAVPSTPTRP
ncbi:hypothetical protein PFICI_05062 [Pestalotiopsis fici W106-1]|uniref:Uncharacterized protein n=1 Tax=Pestalotiopsis fici (strain W106-1 / CGMCC3.15140) TaxID=1229662 RepID=W3XDC9_PESFW|nr:uncharacterized protein PFICI_05062 [Pestalotiopsis fici W106-1]ETS83186.1 hypothetical protein PFICI_05062 [Pestalotiopsis fici W106-1]